MNRYRELEKIASRAWKSHIGELTDEAINRLKSSGVFNQKKELKGLRRGTGEILRKNNARVVSSEDKMSAHIVNLAKHNLKQVGQTASKEDLIAARNTFKENLRAMSAIPQEIPSLKNKRMMFSDKKGLNHYTEHARNLGRDDLEHLGKRNNREDHKWAKAILERHEADEIRYGTKSLNNPKKVFIHPQTAGIHSLTQSFSHLSPKVLGQESANTALAPQKAKKYMNTLREPSGESLYLKEHNINYGKSGVYDKKSNNKLEKKIISENKNVLRGAGLLK